MYLSKDIDTIAGVDSQLKYKYCNIMLLLFSAANIQINLMNIFF